MNAKESLVQIAVNLTGETYEWLMWFCTQNHISESVFFDTLIRMAITSEKMRDAKITVAASLSE